MNNFTSFLRFISLGTIDLESGKSSWANIKVLVAAIVLALGFRSFAYQHYRIPTGSMINTLLVGDFLFVNKFAYGYGRYSFPFSSLDSLYGWFDGRIWGSMPKRGDVVVFRSKHDKYTDYIKRVIGLPGDKIQFIDGVIYLNDQALPREKTGIYEYEDTDGYMHRTTSYKETLPNGHSYTTLAEPHGSPLDNTGVYYVPEGHIFGVGDNRHRSGDSRILSGIGFIPYESIVGQASFRFLSFDYKTQILNPISWVKGIRIDRFLTTIN